MGQRYGVNFILLDRQKSNELRHFFFVFHGLFHPVKMAIERHSPIKMVPLYLWSQARSAPRTLACRNLQAGDDYW
jgi:hypothetical protein